jgi:hypothetical protein
MSAGERPVDPTAKAIVRADFEAVIRRAFEMSLTEADADEKLSEEEVIRIATELGLSAKHARQALYELPELESPPSIFEKQFGPAVISSSRAVPGDAHNTLRRLEDYLHTREYLQVVRRRQGRLLFMPADDTISYLARGMLRPSHRFQLSRARHVALTARPLDGANTHVQIATDMSDQRKRSIRTGLVGGTIGGIVVGGISAFLAGVHGPEAAAPVLAAAMFAAGLGATVTTTLSATAARFKARMAAARLELDGLLDRAERGEALEPPAAPWRRRLQLKMAPPRPADR